MLAQFALNLAQTMPLFTSLLSLPPDDRYPALPMSPQRQKQKTFEAIVELLMRAAEKGPVRLIVEDLHWADSSTLDLIDLLIERLSGARLLLILPFRPEFVAPWPRQAHITEMTLGRLSRAPTERMIRIGRRRQAAARRSRRGDHREDRGRAAVRRGIDANGPRIPVARGARRPLRTDQRAAVVDDSLDPSRLLDGAAGSAWNGEGSCSIMRDDRQGFLLRVASRGFAARRDETQRRR